MSDRNSQRVPTLNSQSVSKLDEIKNKLYSFAGVAEGVELPSEGMFYEDNHPLYGKTHLEVKPMTAKEEDFLVSKPLIKKGTAIDRVIQSLLVDNLNPNLLLVGDKNAVVVAIRISGFGPKYETKVECPLCGNSFDHSFDLNEVKRSELLSEEQLDQLGVKHVGGRTFETELPLTNLKVQFNLMNGQDETKLKQLEEAKVKSKLELSPTIDFLKTVLVSVEEDSSQAVINEVARELPAIDSRALVGLHNSIMPNLDMTSMVECSRCGESSKLEIPLTIQFFWPKR